jgi:4-amino-4-deoxy-L-arabinose transferase-like glycosyltransferase
LFLPSEPDPKWTLIGAIAGWIAGFAGSILTPYITERRQRKFERRGLAAALKGEIDAILLIAEKRNFIKGFESDIQKLRNAGTATFSSDISITENYFEIFSANAARIGSLGQDVSTKVAEAYTLTKSFFEDVKSIRVFEFRDPDTNQPSTAVQAAYYEQMLDMLKSAKRAGEEASIKLGALS